MQSVVNIPRLHCFFPLLLQPAVYIVQLPAAYAVSVAVLAHLAHAVGLDVARLEGTCLTAINVSRCFPVVIAVVEHQPAFLAMQAAILIGSLVDEFAVVGIVFAIQPIGAVTLHIVLLDAGTGLATEAHLQPFFAPGTVGSNVERVAAFSNLRPDTVLLTVRKVACQTGLAKGVYLGIFTVLKALLVVVGSFVILVRTLYERILLAYLPAVAIVVLAAQGTVVVVVQLLAILTTVLVVHLAFQLARGVEGAIDAVQLAVFVGFLFLHPAFTVVELEGAFLVSVAVGAFAPQLVVLVLGIFAIVKTILELGLYVGRVIAVDDAAVAIERLVGLQIAVEETAVAHVNNRNLLYGILLLRTGLPIAEKGQQQGKQ